MYKFCKGIFDFLVALLAVVILSPILIIIFIAIKVSGAGAAIFCQQRAGKDGRPFTLYKFRTMKTGTEPFGPSPKSQSDNRLTKIGKLLREHSLDELPQLFNVLRRDMSIVGPRPLYISQMAEWDERQKTRLNVKPGLTGLAQISGRGELMREEKLELDAQYIEKANFSFDLKIIFLTFAQVFGKKSIYEKRYSSNETTRGQKD